MFPAMCYVVRIRCRGRKTRSNGSETFKQWSLLFVSQSIIEREHGVIWGAHHHYVFVLVKEILIHMSDGNQCATNKTLLFRVLKGCYYTPCYMDCFNKWNVNSVPNQPGVHGMIYSFSFFLVHVKMKQICIPSCGEAPNHKWMQKVAMSCDITQQRCFLELWNLSGMLTIRVSQHEQTKKRMAHDRKSVEVTYYEMYELFFNKR